MWMKQATTAPLSGVGMCRGCVRVCGREAGLALGMAMPRFIVWQWKRVGLALPGKWKKDVLRFISPWSPPPLPSSPPCWWLNGLPMLQRSCCLPVRRGNPIPRQQFLPIEPAFRIGLGAGAAAGAGLGAPPVVDDAPPPRSEPPRCELLMAAAHESNTGAKSNEHIWVGE